MSDVKHHMGNEITPCRDLTTTFDSIERHPPPWAKGVKFTLPANAPVGRAKIHSSTGKSVGLSHPLSTAPAAFMPLTIQKWMGNQQKRMKKKEKKRKDTSFNDVVPSIVKNLCSSYKYSTYYKFCIQHRSSKSSTRPMSDQSFIVPQTTCSHMLLYFLFIRLEYECQSPYLKISQLHQMYTNFQIW